MRRILLLIGVIALCASIVPVSPARAQSTPTPRLIVETKLSDSRDVKFPSVATTPGLVHVGAGVGQASALVWTKNTTATSFGAGFTAGPALGQPDYSTVALTGAPDGSLYAAWASVDEQRIYMRRRDTSGNWGARATVVSGGFRFFPQIAVASDGVVYVTWQQVDRPIYISYSSNQGGTWTGPVAISPENTFSIPPSIAAGPNGQVAVAYSTVGLGIKVSFVKGSTYTNERVTSEGATGNPSVSYGPDGKVYVAWRGIADSGSDSGAFYAERQAANSYPSQRLVQAKAFGTINVVADSNGTLHFGWIAAPSGDPKFYYAYKPSGGSVSAAVSSNVGTIFNSRLAVSLADQAYAHAALERFEGDIPYAYYNLFAATSPSAISATPVIENGDEQIKKLSAVSVSFTGIQGKPTQIRWRWTQAPTDSSTDSNGWQTFTNPISVPIPSSLIDSAACKSITLYTQVRDASNVTESPAKSDSTTIDPGVDVALLATNPYMLRKSPIFTGPNGEPVLGDKGTGGASDGDAAYTRDPLFYLELDGRADCSSITDVATGRSTTSIAPPDTVTDNFFANIIPFPGTMTAGTNTVTVRVSDGAGNYQDYPQTFTYDTTAPQLNTSSPGTLSVTSNSRATVMTQLQFQNIQVTDNAYNSSGRQFWGVWVANSRSVVSSPSSDTSLVWLPLKATGTGTSFNIDGWSLATGMSSSQMTPGTYYVYVRLLDGAGNPTSGYLTASVTLTKVTYPSVYMPMLRRR